MPNEIADNEFYISVIHAVKTVCEKINKLQATGLVIRGLPISTIFHDNILKELIDKNPNFSKGEKSYDLSYKGERWELKTNRGKKGECTINAINVFENVKIIIVNALPEKNEIFSIRLLEAKDEYFNPPQLGKTQMREINELGKKAAIQIYP